MHVQPDHRPAVRSSGIHVRGLTHLARKTSCAWHAATACRALLRGSSCACEHALCAAQAVKQAVDRLYTAGVRRFVIMGAPPLHDAPTMRVMAPSLAASDLGRLAAFGLQTGLDAQTQVCAPCPWLDIPLNVSTKWHSCPLPTTDPGLLATPELVGLATHLPPAPSGRCSQRLVSTTLARGTPCQRRKVGAASVESSRLWPFCAGAGGAPGRAAAAARRAKALLPLDAMPVCGVRDQVIVPKPCRAAQALVDAFPLLYPAAKGVFFPLNTIFLDAKNRARNYGFTNVADACYDGAVPGIAAPASTVPCGNPDEYIYWVRPCVCGALARAATRSVCRG